MRLELKHATLRNYRNYSCHQVRVCAFCSQQFNDPAAYRPTEEIKAAAHKRAVTEETRAKEKVLHLLLVFI
jgi:hypothetical protein